jgi:aspartyl-tRNA(Asn)/glutamyl-tRNA(Gln) amidotransferase subunit A
MKSNLTIKDLVSGFKNGEFSVEEVTKNYIQNVRKHNAKFNVYVKETEDFAIQQAQELDKKGFDESKPLYGVPMGLKDVFSTKGIETTACSNILAGYKPPFNAPVVDRLYDSGTVMLGKLNTDEFTLGSSSETSCFGVTRNPYNAEHVAGGSSGGSAAAIPLDMGCFTMGTDTGGSIRLPASFCNAVGLKVTYGRVPRSGVIPMASSLDTIGHFTKTVEDAAMVLEVTAGAHVKDSTTPNVSVPKYTDYLDKGVNGLKIGIPKEYFIEGVDPEVKQLVMDAVKVLEGQGAIVKEVSLPYTKYGVAVYYVVAPSEISANVSRFDGIRFGLDLKTSGDVANDLMEQYLKVRGKGFGDEVKRRIMVGTYALSSGYYDAYYLKAQKVRTLIIQDFENVFKEVDVLCSPVTPGPAFKVGEKVSDPISMYLNDALTIPSNCAGIPGISVPAGFTKAGLPVGLQILAPQFEEGILFQVGNAYERETEFWKELPKGL